MICTTARRASEQFAVGDERPVDHGEPPQMPTTRPIVPDQDRTDTCTPSSSPDRQKQMAALARMAKSPTSSCPPFLAPRRTLEAAPLFSTPLASEADRARSQSWPRRRPGVGGAKRCPASPTASLRPLPPRYAGRSRSLAVAARRMLPSSAKAPSRQGTRLSPDIVGDRRTSPVRGETDMLVSIEPGVCRAALV